MSQATPRASTSRPALRRNPVFRLDGAGVRSPGWGQVRPPASVLLFVASCGQALGAYVAVAVLARTLSLHQFAIWGLQQVAYQLVGPILSLGLVPVIASTNVLTASNKVQQRRVGRSRLRTALQLTAAVTAVVTVLTKALAPAMAWPVCLAGGAWVLPQLFYSDLRARERWAPAAVLLVTQSALGYGSGVASLWMTRSVSGYWIGVAVGSTATAAVIAVITKVRIWDLRPAPRTRSLVKRSTAGIPATAANLLTSGSLRPFAGLAGGEGGIAALTLASQYAQFGGLVQQVYWSRFGPAAIRGIVCHDDVDVNRVQRRGRRVFLLLWAGQAVLAFPVLRLLGGRVFDPKVALPVTFLLCLLPLASISYDTYAGAVWRSGNTALLSAMSVVALALTAVLALAGALAGILLLLPVALLAARVLLGRRVRSLSLKARVEGKA
jgi:O-antigen/teichoic acid export membrane protein